MKVGFVGLGKLGLPVALAVESKGHKVYGFDIKKEIYEQIKKRKIDYKTKEKRRGGGRAAAAATDRGAAVEPLRGQRDAHAFRGRCRAAPSPRVSRTYRHRRIASARIVP